MLSSLKISFSCSDQERKIGDFGAKSGIDHKFWSIYLSRPSFSYIGIKVVPIFNNLNKLL